MTSSAPKAPLSGVRIIDLTSVIMGPFATHILADLGADVVKVESPEGDSLRTYAPQRHRGMSGSFLNLNRNKRSICLDLKSAAGRSALDRLIETADVFVHNLRPGPIGRLGYAYDRVRGINPEIIYCGAYGFGSGGPYAEKAAYDDIIQAGSGIAALYQAAHGAPAYAPTVICDKLAGQAIAYAVLAALFHRERGGGGQAIEVPMFETSIEFNLMEHMGGFAFEPALGPPRFARVLSPSRKPYATLDGFICILPYSDKNWRDFYAFTGRREFENDARLASLASRVLHIEELYRMVEEEAAKRTTEAWLAFCDRVGIPSMPVRSLEELPDDPHVRAVGLFETAEHPTEGPYRVVRRPVSFSNAPFEIERHAPTHGEHTVEVLRAAGLTPEGIAAVMRETGGEAATAQDAPQGVGDWRAPLRASANEEGLPMLSPDAPIPLEEGDIQDPAGLAAVLQAGIPDLEAPIQFFKFTAGNSNLTYLVRAGERELVLKREPPGAKARSAHDMRREFRVISAVHAPYPLAPRPLLICEDLAVLGGVFFVMERVKGAIVREANAAALTEAQAREQFLGLISALADLHDLDVATGDLAALGRPAGYVGRQVAGWRGRMADARTPDALASEDIERWLADNIPEGPQLAALVHNDFKMDNLVWDISDPTRLVAVLDWEMATLGDPLMDLGVTLSFWLEASDPESFRSQRAMPSIRPRVPSRAEAWDAYLARRGLKSDGFRFYLCFALYRRAVIEQQKYSRFRSGQSRDPRFAGLNVAAGGLLDMCRRQMRAPAQV